MLDAIIIPGGESTTISRLLENAKMLHKRALNIPIIGTCAGCILLAKEVENSDVHTLGLMDIRIWGNCKVLAKLNDKIVAAQQNNLIALAFHPELTNDTRIHKYSIKLIKNCVRTRVRRIFKLQN
ncbi:MAG: hypothetical protein QME47_04205 [Candidatus Thermoplasmatota archaeon]|nr:hypothetical protein [Candidatus Thermoplasmatota archaeon]